MTFQRIAFSTLYYTDVEQKDFDPSLLYSQASTVHRKA